MDWSGRRVLVTGGASFIGSHLVDALVDRGAQVRVADDLSSGRLENLHGHVEAGAVEFLEVDLREADHAGRAVADVEIVFHLAASHGGRGYIDSHPVECSTNLILDGQVFRQAARAGVGKVVYASSGCVYPCRLQEDPEEEVYLAESMVGPPYEADGLYGWAKLMGEMSLRAYCRGGHFEGVSLRYFTAYGPRCSESHAVIAMLARALTKQDPFVVWGDGRQIRNWTHVEDIVEGTLRAAERTNDGTAINLGTRERVSVLRAVQRVLEITGHQPEIRFDPGKPTGPRNRCCDNGLARRLLGWEPSIDFDRGLERTAHWYTSTRSPEEVAATLEHRLEERAEPREVAPLPSRTG